MIARSKRLVRAGHAITAAAVAPGREQNPRASRCFSVTSEPHQEFTCVRWPADDWSEWRAMVREHSLTTDLIVGVIGALAGVSIADILGVAYGGFLGNVLFATAGATLLVFTVGMIRSRRTLARHAARSDAPHPMNPRIK